MRAFWRNKNEGSAQVIGLVVGLLVAIIIGVMVWYKLNAAIFDAATPPGVATTTINATFLTVNTTANTIWTLFPIVAIVMIAGVILAIVTNFGRGQA